jgi:hypothetical protein
MMAVAVKAVLGASPSFEPSKPEPLFEAHPVQQPGVAFLYDVMADGKQFLVVTNAGASGPSPMLNVMVNWDAGLKK